MTPISPTARQARPMDTEDLHMLIYRHVHNAIKDDVTMDVLSGSLWQSTKAAAEETMDRHLALPSEPAGAVWDVLFPPETRNDDGSYTSHDADDNLAGALFDLRRLREKGSPPDEVCLRTIERVLKQINQARATLTAPPPPQDGAGQPASDGDIPDDENLRLKALVTALHDACVVQDSYGVQGSDFSTCLCCGAGGAPGIKFEHTDRCAVAKAEAAAERWLQENRDEIEEYEDEERRLRARIKELETAATPPAPVTEPPLVERHTEAARKFTQQVEQERLHGVTEPPPSAGGVEALRALGKIKLMSERMQKNTVTNSDIRDFGHDLEHAARTLAAALRPAQQPVEGEREAIVRMLLSRQEQIKRAMENPKLTEQQQECWSSMFNENADNIDAIRRRSRTTPAQQAAPTQDEVRLREALIDFVLAHDGIFEMRNGKIDTREAIYERAQALLEKTRGAAWFAASSTSAKEPT